MQTMIHSIELIASNPNVRGGRPCVAGTTIELSDIVQATILQGLGADEIAADYDLSLAQVYASLAYYYDNKTEIDATIRARRQLALHMKEQRIGSRHSPLFG